MKRIPLLPSDAEVGHSGKGVELKFVVPDDYDYVRGHFPGNPIVPGVTQVGWAIEAAKRLTPLGLFSVSRYRFLKPVRPGQEIRVAVQRDGERIQCLAYADGALASKGVLIPREIDDGA